MRHRPNFWTAVLVSIGFGFGAASVQARDASSYSAQELMEALAQRFSRVLLSSPTRSSPAPEAATVLLEEKALRLAPGLKSTPTLRILTQEQLVAEQRAVFIIVSQMGKQGPDMMVDYEIPTNASSGTLRITEEDGKLAFKIEDSYRSSSGSRATYARLYAGVACRDNTEMAYRFSFYVRRSESGVCTRPAFPSDDLREWMDW